MNPGAHRVEAEDVGSNPTQRSGGVDQPEEPVVDAGSRGPIFLGTGGRGRQLTQRGMSADAIYDVCRSRAKEAGIKPFSPHDLRRTSISDMLDAGADISSVKSVAGHSQIETTARYDRRGERAKEATASLLRI